MNRKQRRKEEATRKHVKLPTFSSPEAKAPVLGDRIGLAADIPHEILRQRSLFIATPMYGGQCTGIFTKCMLTLIEVCKDIGIQTNVHFLFNESLIQRGRNYCSDEFMRARVGPPPPPVTRPVLDEQGVPVVNEHGQPLSSPVLDEKGEPLFEPDNRPYFTHMLFIDSDIAFDPKDIIFMLALADPGSDKDVICGPYPKKCIAWEKIKTAVDKGFARNDPNVLERFVGDYVFNPADGKGTPLNQPFEILEGGTGFMMIQRQAFTKFEQTYPTQYYRPDHVRTKHFDGKRPIMAYFDCVIDRGYTFDDVHILMKKAAEGEDVKDAFAELINKEQQATHRYLSEDYFFCQRIRKAGGHVWMLPWIKLSHAGTYIFGGSVLDLAQLGVTATADPTQLSNKK